MKHGSRILMDTNAILEAHRVKCWASLCGYYSIETVSECIIECNTGKQCRKNFIPVNIQSIQKQTVVHNVNNQMLAELRLKTEGSHLDPGEEQLLAYAITQPNTYLICSPDRHCINAADKIGLLDKIVPLESLAEKAGNKNLPFLNNYTNQWHRSCCVQIALDNM